MQRCRLIGLVLTVAAALGVSCEASRSASRQEPAAAGSRADAADLADAWPRGGPRRLWSHDLWHGLGCSASPVEYRNTIVALVGGEGRAPVAFEEHDGSVVWSNLDFVPSYATPKIMRIHGADQLVAFMATAIVGADPRSGELLWQDPIPNPYPQNICAPIQVDEDIVFVSTTEAGSRGLKIVKDRPFRVEETIYGTSGIESGPRMSAIDGKTG